MFNSCCQYPQSPPQKTQFLPKKMETKWVSKIKLVFSDEAILEYILELWMNEIRSIESHLRGFFCFAIQVSLWTFSSVDVVGNEVSWALWFSSLFLLTVRSTISCCCWGKLSFGSFCCDVEAFAAFAAAASASCCFSNSKYWTCFCCCSTTSTFNISRCFTASCRRKSRPCREFRSWNQTQYLSSPAL